MNKIHPSEVTAVLRDGINGSCAVRLCDPAWTWNGAYCNDVAFFFGDWRIEIFNDCGELDYVARCTAPDGRQAEFEDLFLEDNDPIDLLTDSEQGRLEAFLETVA